MPTREPEFCICKDAEPPKGFLPERCEKCGKTKPLKWHKAKEAQE